MAFGVVADGVGRSYRFGYRRRIFDAVGMRFCSARLFDRGRLVHGFG